MKNLLILAAVLLSATAAKVPQSSDEVQKVNTVTIPIPIPGQASIDLGMGVEQAHVVEVGPNHVHQVDQVEDVSMPVVTTSVPSDAETTTDMSNEDITTTTDTVQKIVSVPLAKDPVMMRRKRAVSPTPVPEMPKVVVPPAPMDLDAKLMTIVPSMIMPQLPAMPAVVVPTVQQVSTVMPTVSTVPTDISTVTPMSAVVTTDAVTTRTRRAVPVDVDGSSTAVPAVVTMPTVSEVPVVPTVSTIITPVVVAEENANNCNVECTKFDFNPVCASNGECLHEFPNKCVFDTFSCQHPSLGFLATNDERCTMHWLKRCTEQDLQD